MEIPFREDLVLNNYIVTAIDWKRKKKRFLLKESVEMLQDGLDLWTTEVMKKSKKGDNIITPLAINISSQIRNNSYFIEKLRLLLLFSVQLFKNNHNIIFGSRF